jgi:hypothetical protein
MKIHRDFRQMLTQVGATVVSVEPTGSGHVRVTLQASDGRTCRQVFPATPSDHRGVLNMRAAIRRFLNGRQNKS